MRTRDSLNHQSLFSQMRMINARAREWSRRGVWLFPETLFIYALCVCVCLAVTPSLIGPNEKSKQIADTVALTRTRFSSSSSSSSLHCWFHPRRLCSRGGGKFLKSDKQLKLESEIYRLLSRGRSGIVRSEPLGNTVSPVKMSKYIFENYEKFL